MAENYVLTQIDTSVDCHSCCMIDRHPSNILTLKKNISMCNNLLYFFMFLWGFHKSTVFKSFSLFSGLQIFLCHFHAHFLFVYTYNLLSPFAAVCMSLNLGLTTRDRITYQVAFPWRKLIFSPSLATACLELFIYLGIGSYAIPTIHVDM